MATSYDVAVRLQISGDRTSEPTLHSQIDTISWDFVQQFISGTSSGQIDRFYAKRHLALAAGTDLDIDLTAAAIDLFDHSSINVAFAKVKAIAITNLNTTAGHNITLRTNQANPFSGPLGGTTPTLTIPAGGSFCISTPDGWAVTNSSSDVLRIHNDHGSAAIDFDLVLLGTSA